MTTKTKTFARLLHEIDERQRDLGSVRSELGRIRAHHLPESYYSETARDSRARARSEEEKIEELAEREAELADEVERLWGEAAEVQDSGARLEGDDEELQDEISVFEERRRRFAAEHGGRLRESAHAALDAGLQVRRDRLEALLTVANPNPSDLDAILFLWPLRDPDLTKALHLAVDSRTDFSPLSRAEYEQELRRLDQLASRRRTELQLRAAEREASEAEQARAAIASQLQTITT